MRTTWNFNTAGQIVFGRDSVKQLGDIAQQLGAVRVLIITDTQLQNAGLVDRVSVPLVEAGCQIELFTEGRPDPPVHSVMDGVEVARGFQPVLISKR